MIHKILFAGDLHKRMKDIATISGYADVCIETELDLMRKVKELGCTEFVSLGDWFDKGYGSDTSAALAHTDIDREFAKIVKGNFFGLIGNHIRINLDTNPELFLIQPHPYYKSRHRVIRKTQVIRTPEYLMFGNVQISFMHYNKDATNAMAYTPTRKSNTKFHIALYHTPYVVPTYQLHNIGMVQHVNENSAISIALTGVDYAIVGDIHKPIGSFKISKSDGDTTVMVVPGSLTNTDAGLGSRHSSIEMPYIEINDETDEVDISYVHFDLRINELTFMDKTLKKEDRDKLKAIRGNNQATLYEGIENVSITDPGTLDYLSLNAFIAKQGYTENDKKILKSVMKEPENIDKLLSLYSEDVTSSL